jgi:hypothetical protein
LIGWLILIFGIFGCIKCGPLDMGYIGDAVINMLRIGAIVLGVIGLLTRQGSAARN